MEDYYTKTSSRELWIDTLRGVGILLVVLGHCGTPIDKYIYSFHMPFFFMLSGLLWKDQDSIKNYAIKKVIRYIIPYFIMCVINLLMVPVRFYFTGESSTLVECIIGILYSRGSVKWMPTCVPLWFLTCIYITMVLFCCIRKLPNTVYQMSAVICCGLVSYLLYIFDIFKLPWNIDTALMGVVFVEIGVLIRRVITKFELKKENFVIIPIGILISFIAAYLNSPVDFNGNTYGNIILMFFGAVPVSISIMIACRSIFSIHRRERLLSYLGQHTLFIMGFDLLSLNFTKVVLGMMGIENWINVFIFKMILLLVGSLIWTKIIDLIPNKKISKVLRY